MQCSVLQSILLTGTDPFLKTVEAEGFLLKKLNIFTPVLFFTTFSLKEQTKIIKCKNNKNK